MTKRECWKTGIRREGDAIFVILALTSASIVEYHEADDEGDESGLQVTMGYFFPGRLSRR